ncbi:MAG: HEAT repeat domain-containing protein [Planctomycetota bacterium]|nr:HEAT repeat domain-containing protein [Planctomycetota bacterium]
MRKNAKEVSALFCKLAEDEKQPALRRAMAVFHMPLLSYSDDRAKREEQQAALDKLHRAILTNTSADPTLRAAAAVRFDPVEYDKKVPELSNVVAAGITQAANPEIRTKCIKLTIEQDNDQRVTLVAAALKDPKPMVRDYALTTLYKQGPDAAAAVPAIVEYAEKLDGDGRDSVAYALGQIGANLELVMPLLSRWAGDKDTSLKNSALVAMALVTVQNKLPPNDLPQRLATALGDENSSTNDLLRGLEAFGPAASVALPQIIPLLKNEGCEVPKTSFATLGAIGPAAKDAIPDLVRIASSDKYPVEAFAALLKIDASGTEAVKLLPAMLKNQDTAKDVLTALQQTPTLGAAAVPALLDALNTSDDYVQIRVLEVLKAFGPAANDAAPKLKELAADDSQQHFRQQVLETIAAIVPNDPEVRKAETERLLSLEDHQLDDWIKEQPDAAKATVRTGLKSDSVEMRKLALKLLGKMVQPNKAVPYYQRALADKDESVRIFAAQALNKQGQVDDAMLAVLIASIKHESDDQSWELRQSIRNAGRAALPPLINEFLAAKDGTARQKYLEILVEYRDRCGVALPKLIDAAESNPAEAATLWATIALAKLQPQEKKWFDRVIPLAQQLDDRSLRQSALQTIANNGGLNDSPACAALLVAAIQDEDEKIVAVANSGHGAYTWDEATADQLLAMLKNDEQREQAIEFIDGNTKAKPQLVAPLKACSIATTDDSQRHKIVSLLIDQEDPGLEVLLEFALDSKNPAAGRAEVIRLFGSRTSLPAQRLSERIAPLLNDPDKSVHRAAAAVLAGWGYDWAPLEKHIAAGLTDKDNENDDWYSSAIRDRADEAAGLVKPLMEAYKAATGYRKDTIYYDLSQIGTASPEVIPFLINEVATIEDPDSINFTEYLGGLGSPAYQAVLARAKTSSGKELDQLLSVIGGLARFGSQGFSETERVEAVAILKQALSSPDEQIRQRATVVLPILDSNHPELLKPLRLIVEYNHKLKHDAYWALGKLPNGAEALPLLREKLKAGDERCIITIGSIGPAAAAAVPELIPLLSSSDDFKSAAKALGNIGPPAAAAIPALEAHLADNENMAEALVALSKIIPDKRTVLLKLLPHMKHPYRRYTAVAALGSLENDGGFAVATLLAALKNPDPELQQEAVKALRQLGPVAAAAVEPLLAIAAPGSTSATDLQCDAISALGRINSQPEKVVPVLIQRINDSDFLIRRRTIEAIGQIGPAASAAAAPLAEQLLKDNFVHDVAAALAAMGPAANAAIPSLIGIAKGELTGSSRQPSDFDRSTAIFALAEIGTPEQVLPVLEELSKERLPEIRNAAKQAIKQLNTPAKKEASSKE